MKILKETHSLFLKAIKRLINGFIRYLKSEKKKKIVTKSFAVDSVREVMSISFKGQGQFPKTQGHHPSSEKSYRNFNGAE